MPRASSPASECPDTSALCACATWCRPNTESIPGRSPIRSSHWLTARHHPAHHAHLVGALGAEPSPGEQHLLGEPRPEYPPAGDAGAVHHGDGRLRDLPPAPAHAQVDLHLAGVPGVRAVLAHVVPPQNGLAVEGHLRVPLRGADVVPGAEVLARPG